MKTNGMTLKCGKRTFFFDVKQARNGSNYLRITESLFMGEGQEHKKSAIVLFKEDIDVFAEMMKRVSL